METHIIITILLMDNTADHMLTGMLLHQVKAAGPVNLPLHRLPRVQGPVAEMDDGAVLLPYGQYLRISQGSQIPGLSTAFRIKGRLIQANGPQAVLGLAADHTGVELMEMRVLIIQCVWVHEDAPFWRYCNRTGCAQDMLHYTGKTGRKQDLFENRYNLGENPYSALTKPDRPATIAVLIRVIHIGELDGDIMQLDYRNTRPIYMQIVEQIRQKILAGVLAEGEQLPSVREMAMELAINPNTMQRAYRELEVQGWIYSVPGKGSYVCDIARAGAARCKELLASLDRLVAELVSLG